MELFASFLSLLCIALCARVVWGNKKLQLAEYDRDECRDRAAHSAEVFWKVRDREDKLKERLNGLHESYDLLEKDRDQANNALKEVTDECWSHYNRAKQNEEIANLAMKVGLQFADEEWERGNEAGLQFAAFVCRQYPTSKGSTLAKRIAG